MTDIEILNKALYRASINGYSTKVVAWTNILNDGYYTMIFAHEFAKAFWGSEMVSDYGKTHEEYKQEIKDGMHYPYNYEWHGLDFAWGFHLKSMVLQEDPIKYLEKFI